MRSLYVRIWLTVVAVLALFALVSGALVQRHLEAQRQRADSAVQERMAAWADLLQRTLPAADAPPAAQQAALREWSQRLRVPMALDDAQGQRIGASDSWLRRELERPEGVSRRLAIVLDDGRTLWVPRPGLRRMGPPGAGGWPQAEGAPGRPPDSGPAGVREGHRDSMRDGMRDGLRDADASPVGERGPRSGPWSPPWSPPWLPPWLPGVPDGLGLVLLLGLLFLGVAAGAYPVVRRLTRRLETLQRGVEAFGAGALHQRVPEDGRDEVAALGASFNHAATRIQALLRSHQSLLANASHELRSPLARLKMALAMLDETPAEQAAARAALKREIATDMAELDALVEEVLLASRLDASMALERRDRVELLAVVAEEAARVGASAAGEDLAVPGDERLLRRALRNLFENAQRYGGTPIEATVQRVTGQGAASPQRASGGRGSGRGAGPGLGPGAGIEVRVCDRGPGVPEAWRERIFEPFFRLPGHAEREGGVGLGLSLVRQIAERHGGSVRCEPREGGGSCFVISLPAEV